MWLEDVMLMLLLASGVFFIGLPLAKLAKRVMPAKKRNALAEAKEKLEMARIEVEAARLNKEAEKVYGEMYQEALQDDEEQFQQEIKKK